MIFTKFQNKTQKSIELFKNKKLKFIIFLFSDLSLIFQNPIKHIYLNYFTTIYKILRYSVSKHALKNL